MATAASLDTMGDDSLPCQRHLFALPPTPVYLSGASRSPMPRCVVLAGMRALRRKAETPWSIASARYSDVDETLRRQWAVLINATADDFSFAPSCSYAISCAANSIYRAGAVRQGDVVLVLADQMSSNVYPWQHLCERTGAKIKVVSESQDWTQGVLDAITSSGQVKVLAIPHVHWCDGALLDLVRISKVCRGQGTILVVDATQSLGALPFDAATIQPDFLAAASHKWLMGPYGVCLLYASQAWHGSSGKMWPLEHHEHNRWNPESIDCLPMDSSGHYEPRFKTGARALDSGGRPNPVLMPIASKALELVLRWGPERVRAHLQAFTDRVAAKASTLGLHTPKHRAGHIVGVSKVGDREWSDRCSSFLKSKGVIVASRFGKLRVAPHIYNTSEEVDLLCDLLAEFVDLDDKRSKL